MANTGVNVNPFVGQYSRQSFDRFGDDLCELLLSYLSFEDKKSLECVSKQWFRYIHTNDTKLYLFQYSNDYNKDWIEGNMKYFIEYCSER